MAADNFAQALRVTLIEEGGNDDDKMDHGGRTSRGIIQSEWDAWRRSHPGLPADVWKAPQDQIEAIYHQQYWQPYCDSLPAGLDLEFFDFSVLSGRQQAVKCLQRSLGIDADGMLGLETADTIKEATSKPDNLQSLLHHYADERRAFLRHLAQFPRYGRGWISRTGHVEAQAQKMAGAATDVSGHEAEAHLRVATKEFSQETASPKAYPTDAAKPPVDPRGGAVVATGSGGLAGMLDHLRDSLAPYADAIRIAQYALIGIAVVGFAFTVYGFLHERRTAEALA